VALMGYIELGEASALVWIGAPSPLCRTESRDAH
jgi:hypothetical protein